MGATKYDDDLLVELLAGRKPSFGQISRRLGLSVTGVWRIYNGRIRKDLQQRIGAARSKLPPAERRRPPRPGTGSSRKTAKPKANASRSYRGNRRKGHYDDEMLVQLVARGTVSNAEIARRLGINKRAVSMIVRGAARPDLQPRINAAVRAYLKEAQRLAVRQARRDARAAAEPPQRGPVRRQYDDDLLVELIACGRLSYAEIGRRLGLNKTVVARIARGRLRPDLQTRIDAAARNYVLAARAPGGQQVNPDEPDPAGPRPPGARRKKIYNDELLVYLIACGNVSYAGIGRRVGLAQSTVQQIAAGRSRPDLQPRIREQTEAYTRQARRLLTSNLRDLIKKHLTLGLTGSDDLARKCREWLMDKIWDDPPSKRPSKPPSKPPAGK